MAPMASSSEESTVDSKEDVSIDVDLEMPPTKEKPRIRSKKESWEQLPEGHRGIQIRELWDFYMPQQQWLEQQRWRCEVCHRSCTCNDCLEMMDEGERILNFFGWPEKSNHETCFCCGESAPGRFEGRNLYEVAAEMIIPSCEELQVSYVEKLRRGDGNFDGVKADTFVSHWWGEEFPKFIRALTTFAKIRCANLPWTFCAKKREHEGWAFWICAFANNQYAIEHALGDFSLGQSPRSAVMTSAFATALASVDDVVALLDDQAKIYTRIWCCFELFSVMRLVPQRHGKQLEIFIVDESGVVSSGCGNVRAMDKLIGKVKTREAEASNAADKDMIESAMLADGTTHEELDETLQYLAKGGLKAFRGRRCVEIYTVVSMVSMGLLAISLFVAGFYKEYIVHEDLSRAPPKHVRVKAKHIFINTKDVWMNSAIAWVIIATTWFLLRALYCKKMHGGTYQNNRGLRLNLRLALVTVCIGVKVFIIIALTWVFKPYIGCWIYGIVILYCIVVAVLICCGRNPMRKWLDPVFL
ncbi:unnamed protein product [Durusdinium trenchii]|uniref:Uncharacterized protein n=1 Tax=Durusdinium trenchii TaxID=1381693 RepID=A0ABP0SI70_9DINO